MQLWLDASHGSYGLEAEPSYEPTDPKKLEYSLSSDLRIEAITVSLARQNTSIAMESSESPENAALRPSNHPSLPQIRFMPDGTISESSPQLIRVTGRDGSILSLVESTNRLNYEIRNQAN